MTATTMPEERVYDSGEIVAPGTYVDMENGAIVQVREADELPTGRRTIEYRRRFRRVPSDAVHSAVRSNGEIRHRG